MPTSKTLHCVRTACMAFPNTNEYEKQCAQVGWERASVKQYSKTNNGEYWPQGHIRGKPAFSEWAKNRNLSKMHQRGGLRVHRSRRACANGARNTSKQGSRVWDSDRNSAAAGQNGHLLQPLCLDKGGGRGHHFTPQNQAVGHPSPPATSRSRPLRHRAGHGGSGAPCCLAARKRGNTRTMLFAGGRKTGGGGSSRR